MAKSENQKGKLLYLMKIFYEQTDADHGLTIKELIDELKKVNISAERKSLYDDFNTLRAFGFKIEMDKKKQYCYYLDNRSLELHELKLLVDSVQASKFISKKKSNELIEKLKKLTSKYQANSLQRQIDVSNRVKTMNESLYYVIDFIHEAINSNKQISFQYFDWSVDKTKVYRHNGKRYKLSPWAVTINAENYYLIAYDAEADIIKHFRIDKMDNISPSDDNREGAEHFKNFDLALYTQKTFGMYHGDETLVSLRCKNTMASVIIDRFGRDLTFFKDGDEHFEVRVKVAVSHVFISWVTMFDNDIEITGPASVREEVADRARKMLEIYQ